MNISAYINFHPNKMEARNKLASDIGVEEVTVRSWANGNRHPNRKLWKKIIEATNGNVSLADLAVSETNDQSHPSPHD